MTAALASKESGALQAGMSVDLVRRRDELAARLAELQWDLGGLAYEMAIRNHVRVDVLVRRAAALQEIDNELGEVERILRMEHAGTAGACASCKAPHSGGAAYCWQCGQPLLERVFSHAIGPAQTNSATVAYQYVTDASDPSLARTQRRDSARHGPERGRREAPELTRQPKRPVT